LIKIVIYYFQQECGLIETELKIEAARLALPTTAPHQPHHTTTPTVVKWTCPSHHHTLSVMV